MKYLFYYKINEWIIYLVSDSSTYTTVQSFGLLFYFFNV